MATDLIRYDLRVQDALRGVIRKVMGEAARDGLPGDHHFQIAFRTDAQGVRLSTEMRRRFPQEMTIILQYQFRELQVTEHAIEVVLFFNHVPERILIPFSAVTGFFDPSVDFGLRFDVKSEAPAEPLAKPTPPKLAPVKSGGEPKAKAAAPRGAGSEPTELRPQRAPPAAKTTAADRLATSIAEGKKPEPSPAAPAADDAAGDGKIVSIDAFRRKP